MLALWIIGRFGFLKYLEGREDEFEVHPDVQHGVVVEGVQPHRDDVITAEERDQNQRRLRKFTEQKKNVKY